MGWEEIVTQYHRVANRRSILLVTTQDADLLTLASVRPTLPHDFPAIRTARPQDLTEADLPTLLDGAGGAGVVLLRLIQGKDSPASAFQPLAARCREPGVPLIARRSYPAPDPDPEAATTAPPSVAARVAAYPDTGGPANLLHLSRYVSDTYLGTSYGYAEPMPLPWEGVYHPAAPSVRSTEERIAHRWRHDRSAVGIPFYRTDGLSGDLGFVDLLVRRLEDLGAHVLPVFAATLKGDRGGAGIPEAFQAILTGPDGTARVDCLTTTTAFTMGEVEPGPVVTAMGWAVEGLARLDVPVLQATVGTGTAAAWEATAQGLGPLDGGISVALPEFDGRLITVPIAFRTDPARTSTSPAVDAAVAPHRPLPDRIARLARLALRWCALRRKPNAEKRVAIILHNNAAWASPIGAAHGLDSLASVVALLRAMREAGYRVEDLPETADELARRIADGGGHDLEYLTEAQVRAAPVRVHRDPYRTWFAAFPASVQERLRRQWGEPPGTAYVVDDALTGAGVLLGNVFVGLQRPRGFNVDPDAVYHAPDLPPQHQYLAFYRWLRDEFRADAVVAGGKHGTLEWLPGKGVGLSAACFPEVALDDLPLIYPSIVNNPGEGTQAKRRGHAAIIDHLTPPLAGAGTYGALQELDRLLRGRAAAQNLDPRRLSELDREILDLVRETALDRDLGVTVEAVDVDNLAGRLAAELCELREARIGIGLHVLGRVPDGDALLDHLASLAAVRNGDVPGLRTALAAALGLDEAALLARRAEPAPRPVPDVLGSLDTAPIITNGDVVERLDLLARALILDLLARGGRPEDVAPVLQAALRVRAPGVEQVLRSITDRLYPARRRTEDQLGNVLRALAGRFVPAGPSGAPSRGLADVLPTGRNVYAVDPKAMPSAAAWQVGVGLGDALRERYLAETGAYPESVGIVLWGTANMRTQGEDVAEFLYLLGVRPVWQAGSGWVVGLEPIPLAGLGRPRFDVVARVSGCFRDAFPSPLELMDEAVTLVAGLPAPPELNFVVKHLRAKLADVPPDAPDHEARRASALYRVFAPKPGAYVDGVAEAVELSHRRTPDDLAATYTTWVGYAYGRHGYGVPARDAFLRRAGELDVAVKNRDNQEHDIFDTDGYFQDHGALVATVRTVRGREPRAYTGDSTVPDRPAVRDLADEARRTVRRRVVSPTRIAGMRRHGYKGVAELLKTADYVFGDDATTGIIEGWMYEDLTDRFVRDPGVQAFLRRHNPWTMRDMVTRLLEATQRDLWERPPEEMRRALETLLLALDGDLEGRADA